MLENNYIHNEITHNLRSPRIVSKLIYSLIQPKSVLDVGCGIGTWLKVFKELGVEEVFGIDGYYVNRTLLEKFVDPIKEFQNVDLRNSFNLSRKFDLTLCLEVGEHLPDKSACVLIESICKHSDIVVFSAAIPHQGGQFHLNEQYPKYWENLFDNFGFKCYDLIRPEIWENEHVDYWYRQNIFIAVNENSTFSVNMKKGINSLIIPELFERKISELKKYQDSVFQIKTGKYPINFYIKLLINKFFKR